MRMRGWKRKNQEDEKEGRKKKKILGMQGIIPFFFGQNSAQSKMHAG